MILAPKHIHKITKNLSDRFSTKEAAERYCLIAEIQPNDIEFDVSPFQYWKNIVSIAFEYKETALNLLDGIIENNQNDDNKILLFYKDEISSSVVHRRKKVYQALNEGRCVVFLGPDVLQVATPQGLQSFNKFLCRELEREMKRNLIYYDSALNNNLSYLAQCFAENPTYVQGETAQIAANLFNSNLVRVQKELFRELVKLPLHLVVNANPDKILFESLIESGKTDSKMGYYDFSNICTNKEKVTIEDKQYLDGSKTIGINKESPLVYNMFGTFDELDTVLFTESQFMDFINRVIQNDPGLNGQVLTEFIQKDTYLFLGFDFDQWYFKILFHLFKIKKVDYASLSCGFEQNITSGINNSSVYNREFFEQEFKMFFVSDDITSFIKELNTGI